MSVHLLLYIAYVYMYLCIHLYVYVCIYIWIWIYIHICTLLQSLYYHSSLSQIHADFTLSKVLLYMYF